MPTRDGVRLVGAFDALGTLNAKPLQEGGRGAAGCAVQGGRNGKEGLRAMKDDSRKLQDYRLTTAEILYHLPDYPGLTQSYLWQHLDRIPDFPKLNRFLGSWEGTREGKLHAVRIDYIGLEEPCPWSFADGCSIKH